MPKRADLDAWYRRPGNVTGAMLRRAAEERGWVLDRVRGDHFVDRLPGRGRVLTIDLGTRADGTKRAVIRQLMEDDS